MVSTNETLRPLVIDHGGPLPGNRALALVAPVRVQPLDTIPASAANEFAADWELEDFLRGAGVAILDYEAVCQKMDRLALAAQAAWGWHPLRQQDCRAFADWRHGNGPRLYSQSRDGHFASGYLASEVYPHAVPQAAWEDLVFRIERGFGRPVNFYVTHYQARRPDPFLAATVNGKELYVIAEWARPGRRVALQRPQSRLWRLLVRRHRGYPLWAWSLLGAVWLAGLIDLGLHR